MTRTARRSRLAAFACLLGLVLVAPSAPAVAPPVTGPVAEAWMLFRSFHEDLSRIDRARDLLEGSVKTEPSLEALLLLAWVHL